jgi:general secretion pathway protein G
MTRRTRGFTLLEFVVVVCLVAFLAAHLNERLRRLQVDAERASMEHVIGAVRSAVALEVAAHVVRGAEPDLQGFLGTNPMDRLAEPPGNYLGVLAAPDPNAIQAGHWYFDRSRGLLVYRVRHARFLDTPLPDPRRVRFKFALVAADSSEHGSRALGGSAIQGLRVKAAEPYRWVDPRGAKRGDTS